MLAACAGGRAYAAKDMSDDGGAQQLADVLFPETREWRSINSFPHPAMPELDNLLGAMVEKLPEPVQRDVSCSFVERVMRTPAFRAHLYQGNIFGPADDDLVYVGSAECAEGDFTIVWRHVHDPSRMMSLVIYSRILRLDSAAPSHFTDVARGCCATPTDDYHIAGLSGAHERAVGVFKGLGVPTGSRMAPGRVQLQKESTDYVLPPADPSHPKAGPAMDEDGTITSFKAGTDGEVLMTYRDPAGKLWRLVEIGTKSASDAGWISDDAGTN
jgi:hypothetical protein